MKGLPEYGESQVKKTKYARFVLQLIDNGKTDEDEEERDRWHGKTLRKDLWLTPDSMWRTVEFIKHCGMDIEPGVTVQQYLESCNGCQLQVTVKHRAQEDGDGVFAEVKSTAPLI